METNEQIRQWEDERLELIRASGSGGTILFWIGGAALSVCIFQALAIGPDAMTGFGLATSIGVLIWAVIEHDKKASADRKIRQLDAYLEFARKGRSQNSRSDRV